ncbi:hypothetical protein UlMin_036225 [Ulmus minor]
MLVSIPIRRFASSLSHSITRSKLSEFQGVVSEKWIPARFMSNAAIELKMNKGVVRFSLGRALDGNDFPTRVKQKAKRCKMCKKTKVNELKLYWLKAKKKMNSPNPEVRIRYKLEKAKRKEVWLFEKLRKFEVPKTPAEAYDPEILTLEEKHYLKRTGEKKKNYVPVGRRGVFRGVVLNMHLHWKKHETVKVICRPCKPGSKGIVIDIKADNTIIFYRVKNYVQPNILRKIKREKKRKSKRKKKRKEIRIRKRNGKKKKKKKDNRTSQFFFSFFFVTSK